MIAIFLFCLQESTKEISIIQKKNRVVNHYGFFSNNFEVFVSCASNADFNKFNKKSTIYKALLREISIRINN